MKQKFKSEKKGSSTLRDHSRCGFALKGREGGQDKSVHLLFKSVHGGGGV